MKSRKINLDKLSKRISEEIRKEENKESLTHIDSTKIDLYIDSNKYCWSIIDEIIYSEKVINTEFSQDIVNFFIKTPYIMNILDETGMQTMKPILLYGCIQSGSVYKNIKENTDINSINILDETIDHSLFDTQYIFSSTLAVNLN